MLYRLVLPDRAVEHDAFLRIRCSSRERRAPQAHRFGGDEDALGIETMQQVLEASALLSDAIGDRDLQAVDEDLVGIDRSPPHLRNLARFDEPAIHVRVEERESLRAFLR